MTFSDKTEITPDKSNEIKIKGKGSLVSFDSYNSIIINVDYDWVLSELENRCMVPDEVKKALMEMKIDI